eukprot:6203046-Pleurochrysis_carterae.AAC.5
MNMHEVYSNVVHASEIAVTILGRQATRLFSLTMLDLRDLRTILGKILHPDADLGDMISLRFADAASGRGDQAPEP